jgi:hypothetical protein
VGAKYLSLSKRRAVEQHAQNWWSKRKMITICCTSKLLKRTGLPAVAVIPDPTAALGNWHANILFFHRSQILLFVSDNSRLAVVTPAREARLLAGHLTLHLSTLLASMGVPQEWIEAEVREMAEVSIASTRSRSILGTMNDYSYQIDAMMEDSRLISPLEIALSLSICPIGPMQYRNPADVTMELFKSKYDLI